MNVWWVIGEDILEWQLPAFFDTKLAAERYARMLFPNEDVNTRECRVRSCEVLTMSDLNGG
jgi:hypothetical protein